MTNFRDMKDAPVSAAVERKFSCSTCRKQTIADTLTQYGTRCFNCYEDYCRQSPSSTQTVQSRNDGSKAWAWTLRARELACERLTPAQKLMWRSAIALEVMAEE